MSTVGFENRPSLVQAEGAVLFEPKRIVSGDTVSWSRALPDYPAPVWTLTYYLAPAAGGTALEITATGLGSSHSAVLTAEQTKALSAGRYLLTARVSDGTVIKTLSTTPLRVADDPTAGADRRTHAEKCLAAVEAVLVGKSDDPLVEFEIEGTKAKHLSHLELKAYRDQFRLEVHLERGGSLVSMFPAFGGVR